MSGSGLADGVPQNPGAVRRFMSKAEFKYFIRHGFTFDLTDSRGGISAISVKVPPRNPDYIKNKTGALGDDYYVDIKTTGKNSSYEGRKRRFEN